MLKRVRSFAAGISFLAASVGWLHGQSNYFTNVPPLQGGNGAGGITFNLSALSAPIIVDTIYCAFYTSGTVEMWYNPTPINGSPTINLANGWVSLGTANITSQSPNFSTPQPQAIPIPVGLLMQPGQTLGFAISGPNCAYTTYSSGPSFYSDQYVGIETGPNVGYGGGGVNPTNHPRQFNGGVVYSLANQGGNNAAALGINPGLVCPGNNAMTIDVANFGTNQINSLTVNWTVNGNPQAPIPVNQLLDTIGGNGSNTATIPLGNVNFVTGVPTTIVAWTSAPNGGNDTINGNDTVSVTITPSLTGTYTLDGNQPTAGTNFNNWNDLASALNTFGVCGPVDINVASNATFTEQVTFNSIPGASIPNRINIHGNNATIQFSGSTSDRQVIRFNGASYVTLEDLNIVTQNTTFGWGVHYTGGCTNDTIRNCTLDISSVSSTTSSNSGGVIISGSNTSPTTNGANCDNCGIVNNTFNGRTLSGGMYYGISAIGQNGGGSGAQNLLVQGNEVRDPHFYGIYINDAEGAKIWDNEVHRPTKSSTTTFYGVFITGDSYSSRIERNYIHTPEGTSTMTSVAYGLYSAADVLQGQEILMANNVVYDFGSNGTQYGIYLSSPEYNLVYHNTVSLDDNSFTGTSATYGLYGTSNMVGTEILNNLISVTRTSTGLSYGMYFSTTNAILAAMNNNNVYVNANGTNYYGYYNTPHFTRASFVAASNNQYETLSQDFDPLFTNPGAANFQPQSPGFNNIGANLNVLVPQDITGLARLSSPDPGAWEFDGAANDAGISQFINPGINFCPGNDSIFVRLNNPGSNPLTSVNVVWSVNGVGQPTVNLTGINLPANSDSVLFLGIFPLTGTGPISFQAYTTQPNNTTDAFAGNDTTTISVFGGLAGNYTLDGTLPTGGTNFATWGALDTALFLGGHCGAVDVFVNPVDTIHEQITIRNYANASPQNYLYLHGQGGVLSAQPISANRHLLRLEGAKYVLVDSLTLIGEDATFGYGVHFIGDNQFDTLRYLTVDLSAITSTSTTNSTGLLFSGSNTSTSSTGIVASNCAVEHSSFLGGPAGGPYYGMRMNGLTFGVGNFNNRIAHNKFYDAYAHQVYFNNVDSLVFVGNEMARPTRTTLTTFYGIYSTGDMERSLIDGNIITNPNGGSPGYTGTTYGIYLLGDAQPGLENTFSNNLIYGLNSNGTLYGTYASSAIGNRFLHNTISLDDQSATTGSTTYGAYFTGTGTSSSFVNNIVTVTREGSGTKYGLYINSTAAVDSTENNVVYVNPLSGTPYYGFYSGIQPTLFDYQTNTPGWESNGVSADPLYFNAASGNLRPTVLAVDNIGADLLSLVPNDFFGAARTSTPDPGAIEFIVPNNDAGVFAILNPGKNYCPGSGTVEVNIRNYGLLNLSNVLIDWEINGAAQPQVALSGMNLAQGQDTNVVLGSFNFVSGQTYVVEAYTSQPNSVVDEEFSNDTSVVVVNEGLSGNFTIDPNLPSGGTNFISFNEAADTLESRGICGPIVVEAVSGVYNEQVEFFEVPNSSSVNTVTYRSQSGDSTDVAISFGPTVSTLNYVVRLNGAKHLIFEHLTMKSEGPSNYRVLEFIGGSEHNRVANTELIGDTSISTTSTLRTVIWSQSGSGGDNYNTFEQNRIRGGSYGIYWYGSSAAGGNEVGNSFINNKIEDSYFYGGRFQHQDSLVLHGNDLMSESGYTSTSFGYYTSNTGPGLRIEANRVVGNGEWPNYGFYMTSGAGTNNGPNAFYNNVAIVGDSGVTDLTYGILVDDMVNLRMANNTSIIRESDDLSGAMAVTSGTNIESFNNNLVARGNAIPVIFNSSLFVAPPDYNNYFTSGPFLAAVNNLGYPNLAIWQNQTGWDANAVSVDPGFLAWDDHHHCSPILDGAALPLTGLSTDWDGDARSSVVPDIGADEMFEGANFTLGPDIWKCAGDTVTLSDFAVAPGTYFWSTFESTNTIQVVQPGEYSLFLVGTCSSGTDTVEVFDYPAPTAAFTSVESFLTSSFTNGSTGTALSYTWDFGDGNGSTGQDPIHIYGADGNYTVTLTVTDSCGNSASATKTVVISTTGIEETVQQSLVVYPNPTVDLVQVSFLNTSGEEVSLRLLDLTGREIMSSSVKGKAGMQQTTLNLSGQAKGVYLVEIQYGEIKSQTRIVKM